MSFEVSFFGEQRGFVGGRVILHEQLLVRVLVFGWGGTRKCAQAENVIQT